MKYRSDIDGLRALAVIPVVLYHLGVPGIGGGYVGVDVFFVISGYLITSLLAEDIAQGRFSILKFYERRIRRILPALFLVMACAIPAAWFIFLPGELRLFAQSIVATTLFASNFLFWRNVDYFAAQSDIQPLLHTWSLAIEEQFYIVFPILLFILSRFGKQATFFLLLALGILSFGFGAQAAFHDPQGAFYLPQYRAWELVIGSLLALRRPDIRNPIVADLICVAGILCIGFAIFSFSKESVFPGFNALFPTIGTALVLIAGDKSSRFAGPILRAQPTVFLGRISYSTYLWHWPLIVFSSYYLARDLTLPEAGLVFLLTLGLAAMTWRFVEQPARRTALSRGKIFAAAGAGAILLIVCGAAGHLKNGFPERFPGVAETSLEGLYRAGVCFVDANSAKHWREEKCTYPAKQADAPVAVLWGDSFAAHYLPGLWRVQKSLPFTLIERTMGACQPLVRFTPPVQESAERKKACADFNAATLDYLVKRKPDLLILSGQWYGDQTEMGAALHAMLERLTRAHIAVLIIGESPVFTNSIPQTELRFKRNGVKTQWYVTKNNFISDAVLQAEARQFGAGFFSPRSVLCDARGRCRFTDGKLFFWDIGHLTVHGSELLAARMQPDLAAALSKGRP